MTNGHQIDHFIVTNRNCTLTLEHLQFLWKGLERSFLKESLQSLKLTHFFRGEQESSLWQALHQRRSSPC